MIDYVLAYSMENNRAVAIMYQKGDRLTRRNIRVLDINGGNIKAYCYLRKQIRIFKKENILSADLCRERKIS